MLDTPALVRTRPAEDDCVPDYRAEPMQLAEYAHVLSLQGAPIRPVGGVFWRRVRPLFYRPVLLYKPLLPPAGDAPTPILGGYQHVVGSPEEANSNIAFRVYTARPYVLTEQ